MDTVLHPRSIIRNALALKLINRSDEYKHRVFIQRAVKLDSVSDLPCVSIYTNDDQHNDNLNFGTFKRRLNLQIEIYNRRAPDAIQLQQSVAGMPKQPVNYSVLAQDLDSICLDVERLLIEFIKAGEIKYNNQSVYVEPTVEINTEIQQSESGDVPFSMAILTVIVYYNIDLNECNNYCAFANAVLNIKTIDCNLKKECN
jgi:hypothetical protein